MRDDTGIQLKRLSVHRDFQFLTPEALKEYRRWLEEACSPGEIVFLINEAVMLDKLPTLADLRRLRDKLFPPRNSSPLASQDCPDCAGTGKMLFVAGSYEFAVPCRCGGIPRAWVPYEQTEMPKRPQRDSLQHVSAESMPQQVRMDLPSAPDPKPVTSADIEAIKSQQRAKASKETLDILAALESVPPQPVKTRTKRPRKEKTK